MIDMLDLSVSLEIPSNKPDFSHLPANLAASFCTDLYGFAVSNS